MWDTVLVVAVVVIAAVVVGRRIIRSFTAPASSCGCGCGSSCGGGAKPGGCEGKPEAGKG